MTAPTLKAGLQLLLYRETAVAGTFSFFCGILTKDGTRDRTLAEADVLDCADPTAPPWKMRTAIGRSMTCNGSGQLAIEQIPNLEADYNSNAAHNWRLIIQGVGYWGGAFQLDNYKPTGANTDAFIGVSLTLQSTGAIPWTDDATAGL